VRAAAGNPESARLVGIRVGWMIALGWGMAAAIGGAAACKLVQSASGCRRLRSTARRVLSEVR
jgi:branched-subunit amino acid ABC-type transport system permease component